MPPSGKKPKTSAKPSLKLVSKPAEAKPREVAVRIQIPRGQDDVQVRVAADRVVRLTNLGKLFWTEEGITKGDLIQYYANVAPALLPHLRDRAMVM
jgi:bifunctional non-homologous end joining protein LigD